MLVILSIDGTPITGLIAFNEDELCLHLLGRVPLLEGYKGAYIRLAWLRESFKTPLEGVTKVMLHYHVRTYIINLFGATIFFILTDNKFLCYFLPLLENFAIIHNYNQSSKMIAYLHHYFVMNGCQMGNKSIDVYCSYMYSLILCSIKYFYFKYLLIFYYEYEAMAI